jgi:hypothetical protein
VRRPRDTYGRPGGGYGQPDYRTLLQPGRWSGVSMLDPYLTINGTTVTPTFRFLGKDAAAGGWATSDWPASPVTLALQAGTAPTYNNGAYGLCSASDSVQFNNGGWFAAPDNALADIATEDILFEVVVKWGGTATNYLIGKYAGSEGWLFYEATGTAAFFIQDSGGGSQVKTTTALTDGAYYHIFAYINRDEASTNGSRIYLSGVADGVGVDLSARSGTLTVAQPFAIGARSDGGGSQEATAGVVYAAMWLGADLIQAGADGPTEIAAVAKERAYAWMGRWPQIAKGTATPNTVTRATTAYSFKGGATRTLYQVGAGVLRSVSRNDANGVLVSGALDESAGTNLAIRSQEFDSWAQTRATVSADTAVAPDGTTTMDTLVEDGTAASSHLVAQTINVVSGTTYAMSAWVKQANRSWIEFYSADATAPVCFFDVANGAVGASPANTVDQGIEDWGGGLYRCWMTYTASTTAGAAHWILIAEADGDDTFDGLSQDSLYIWGFQLEAASYPSSYIPTGAASATRNADNFQMPGLGNLGGVGSDQRGTVRCKLWQPNIDYPGSEATMFALSDGGAGADRIEARIQADDQLDLNSAATGGNAGATSPAVDVFDGVQHSFKGRWRTNHLASQVDDTAAAPDISTDPPDDLDEIDIGQQPGDATQFGGILADFLVEKAD